EVEVVLAVVLRGERWERRQDGSHGEKQDDAAKTLRSVHGTASLAAPRAPHNDHFRPGGWGQCCAPFTGTTRRCRTGSLRSIRARPPRSIRRCGRFAPRPARPRHGHLEAADERRRPYARPAGREPRGEGRRGPRHLSRRPPHDPSPLLSRDPPGVRSVAGDPAHPGVRARRHPRRDRGAASARLPVPLACGYLPVRWFHERAVHTLVSSQTLLRELAARKVGGRLVHWPRGVDAEAFHPRFRSGSVYAGLPRPIWLYVGRVAVEKSLEDFLRLPLPGTKVVVGDGPSREPFEREHPEAVWRGFRFGAELAEHYASADCFVFPSRTETFGNVLLEAFAAGLPVASVPAPGPVDLVVEGVNGAVDADLLSACRRALLC